MPRKSKNKFSVKEDTVFITRDEWTVAALATYRDDYYKELTSYTWTLKNGYPSNETLGGLHLYMMRKWYGDDMVKDMAQRGYVVDHMNNEHMDCRISNLAFYLKDWNTAKGQYFDKYSRNIEKDLAITIAKDFSTDYYQLSIACNIPMIYIDDIGNRHLIDAIRILYDKDTYSDVVLDAERIVTNYIERKEFTIPKSSYQLECKIHVYKVSTNLGNDAEKAANILTKNRNYYI